MNPYRPALVLLAWSASLAVAFAILTATGQGSLALPGASVDAWSSWLSESSTPIIAASIARLLAIIGVWYLMASTACSFFAHWIGAPVLHAVAEAVTVAPVKRMTRNAVHVTMAGALALPVGGAFLALGPGTASAATPTSETPMLKNVTPEPGAPTTSIPPLEIPPATSAPAAPRPDLPSATALWTVKTGESMWAAADMTLSTAWGFEPTNAEIVPYWLELIELNRGALKNGNPSLVLPGQTFNLPPVPAAPSR